MVRSLSRVLLWSVATLLASAQVRATPQIIRVDGSVFDNTGIPSTGSKDIQIKLYSASTGGSALWTSSVYNTAVSSGRFSINLDGATLAPYLAALGSSGTAYFEVVVDTGTANGSMDTPVTVTPRIRSRGTAFALTASSADALYGVTTTTLELNRLAGVTTGVQTQLNAKVTYPSGGADGQVLKFNAGNGQFYWAADAGASGGVTGPGAVTSTNAVTRWADASGTSIISSGVTIDNSNNVLGIANLSITGATVSGLTADRVLITTAGRALSSSANVDSTELGYLDNVSANVQTQINGLLTSVATNTTNISGKLDKIGGSLSGALNSGSTITSTGTITGNAVNVSGASNGSRFAMLDGSKNIVSSTSTTSDAEFGYLAGVTSALNLKVNRFTAAEAGYLSGVTANLQTQINAVALGGDKVSRTGDSMSGALQVGATVAANSYDALNGGSGYAIGGYSVLSVGTGIASNNTFVGQTAGSVKGNDVTAIGKSAGLGNDANLNTLLGSYAGSAGLSGSASRNTILGAYAAPQLTGGGYNVIVGHYGATNLTSGMYNTFIGTLTGVSTGSVNYTIAIGQQAQTNANSAVQIGGGTNSTPNSLQFFNYNFLDSSGNATFNSINSTISSAELGYLDGVTAALQTQLNSLGASTGLIAGKLDKIGGSLSGALDSSAAITSTGTITGNAVNVSGASSGSRFAMLDSSKNIVSSASLTTDAEFGYLAGVTSSLAKNNMFTLAEAGYLSGVTSSIGNKINLFTPTEASYLSGATANLQTQIRGIVGGTADSYVALVDGATVAVDGSAARIFKVTLGGNRLIESPTNLVAGRQYSFIVGQDGTGGRRVSWGSKYKGSIPSVINSVTVSGGTGTNIGNMTSGGGLAAAFDGNASQNSLGGAGASSVTAAYVGKDWGAGTSKIISRFRLTAVNNNGFSVAGNTRVTLQGSPDNSSWTTLYDAPSSSANGAIVDVSSNINTSSAYRYHRVALANLDGSSATFYVAEVEFYESAPAASSVATFMFVSDGTNLYYTNDPNQVGGGLSSYAFSPNSALVSDSLGNATASAVTSTELGYLSGVTGALQTQINTLTTSTGSIAGKLDKIGGSVSGALNLGSTLTSTSTITGNAVNVSGASSGSRFAMLDSSKNIVSSASTTTDTEFGYLSGVTSNLGLKVNRFTTTEAGYLAGVTAALQTQLNTKLVSTDIAGKLDKANDTMTGSLGLAYTNVTPNRVAYVDSSRILRTDANVDSTELSYLDTVSANIQTQLNAKLVSTDVAGKLDKANDTMTGSLGLSYANVTPNRVAYVDASRILRTDANVDSTELSYLDAVTQALQTQLNAKMSITTANTLTGKLGLNYTGVTVNTVLTLNANREVTSSIVTDTELAYLDAVTSSLTKVNSFTATEATYLAGVTSNLGAKVNQVTNAEMGYLAGVTQALQTQLSNRMATNVGNTLTGNLGLNYTNVTANRVAYVDASRILRTDNNVDSTELGYLDGVSASLAAMSGALSNVTGSVLSSYLAGLTANIQTQLNSKGLSYSLITGASPAVTANVNTMYVRSSGAGTLDMTLPSTCALGDVVGLMDSASNGTQAWKLRPASGQYIRLNDSSGSLISNTDYLYPNAYYDSYVQVMCVQGISQSQKWQVINKSDDISGSYVSGVSTYTTAGGYTLTVPSNVRKITIKTWGGGGGSGGTGNGSVTCNSGSGGGGAFSYGTYVVTPGDLLMITVGGGGAGGATNTGTSGGAGGGGLSSVFNSNQGTMVIAGGGGGGGGGCSGTSVNGGAGGGGSFSSAGNGTAGTAGSCTSVPGTGGYGGVAGTATATTACSEAFSPGNGTAFAGGNGGTQLQTVTSAGGYGGGGSGYRGNSPQSGGGGGGGGYLGGAGGGSAANLNAAGSGGGGGSSLGASGANGTAGSGSTGGAAGGSGDADYSGTTGKGGNGIANTATTVGNAGSAGRVVISW